MSLCLIASVAALGFGACNSDDYREGNKDSGAINDSTASSVDNTRDANIGKDTAAAAIAAQASAASVSSEAASAASSTNGAGGTGAASAGSNAARTTAGAGSSTSAAKHAATRKYRTTIAMPASEGSTGMIKDKYGVYNMAEVMPQFPGGHHALENYINNHLDYPDQAIDDNAAGTVKVTFVVDENGKVQDARVVGGEKVGDGLEQQALRAVAGMPAWKPGKVHGKNVKTRLELPINFQLDI